MLSLHEEVLSLVENANSQVDEERRVTPRAALTVMNRALNALSSLSEESRRLGVIREVNKFISLNQDTQKAHLEETKHRDLLSVGHPQSMFNVYENADTVRLKYAQWLAADSSIPASVKLLVASAFGSKPFSLERKHAFTRLNVSKDAAISTLFKIDPIVSAFTFRGGNSSAARRARVATQWRDRKGRWVEMGRGIDFSFRLPDGSIASVDGTYVGVDMSGGFFNEGGKSVAGSGLVEVRGDKNLPDGIYSIKSANASPVKARVPGQALKRAKVRSTPTVRTPTAEEAVSANIPNLEDLIKTRLDAPSGWTKQNDGSFLSDDDYKVIPNDTGYTLHRLNSDGNTGDKVADVSSWAEVQSAAEKDSNAYDKFKESSGKRVVPEKQATSLIPDNVGSSGNLPNGITYTAEDKKVRVAAFPGQYAEVDGVRVTLNGNTYDNRENIKRLGFKWDNANKVWYKNFIGGGVLGSSHDVARIKEQLDGIGGGPMPRFAGDNGNITRVIDNARNDIISLLRSVDEPQKEKVDKARGLLVDAGKILNNNAVRNIANNQDDRVKARTKLQEFLDTTEADGFPQGDKLDTAKDYARNAIALIDEKVGSPDQPLKKKAVIHDTTPEQEPQVIYDPPKNQDKNTPEQEPQVISDPPKVQSESTPSTPDLFTSFDVPNGAFQLRTIDYTPEGRIDQQSTDYTDDPKKLATRYPLPILIGALTEAMIGKKDDAILSEIIDSNIGDDEQSLDLEQLNDVVDTPAPQAGRANASGAGSLDFNRGEEFVPAEALYNAVFEAGGDPNRVIANAYDAIHGDRRNLEKLTGASGELPSPEEQKLVDDMMQEIRQLKDATPDGEAPASNIVDQPDQEPLPGELLYNIPIDWENPDYYVPDPSPYIPTVVTEDQNGYSDNPEYLARNFEQADLLQQLVQGITDGSGSSYFVFNDSGYMEGVSEVPVEAVRDALQLLDVNTNKFFDDLKNEANDMSEPSTPAPQEPTPQAPTPQAPQAEASMDGAASAIRDRYSREGLLNDINPLLVLPADGSIVFRDGFDDLYIARPNGSISSLNVSEDWLLDPQGAGQAGWRNITREERRDILGIPQPPAPPQAQAPAPAQEPAPVQAPTPEAPAPAAPTIQYPGPREPGYSPNNTTMVRGGAVVGKGSRVVAVKDGKTGTVVAIQNNPEYLRIRFDDGTTAVRAAAKVKALSDGSGVAPQVIQVEPQKPAQGIEVRLDQPVAPPPRIARSGDTLGVNDDSTIPDWLNGLTNEQATQADYSAWGPRDAEIAKAARERISLANLEKEITSIYITKASGTPEERAAANRRLSEIVGDIYGARSGITFGGEFFSLDVTNSSVSMFKSDNEYRDVSVEEAKSGKASYRINIDMVVRDATGNRVGDIRRYIYVNKKLDENENIVKVDMYAKNDYLVVGGGKKKKGFATAFNRYAENWYIANGIEKVKVYAAGGENYQGGFVWALNGFNWDTDFGSPGVNINEFNRQVKNRQEEAQVAYLKEKIAKAKKPNGQIDWSIYPTPLEFALVGWYPGATDWIGKRVMIKNSWNGTKNLTPQAREQVQAANYNQIKNAERRIDSKQNIPNISSEAQAVIVSDAFRNDKTVAPYLAEIVDVLKNNRSLAVLSPSAKNALNAYISKQLLDKERKMPLDDILRLRTGLDNEYRADHGYSDPFNSAEVLSEFTTNDFVKASEGQDYTDINAAGFTVRALGDLESGVNSTFEVTHVASGQKFFVKNEEFAARWSDVPGGVTELEASILLNASGMQGIHNVRIGKNDKNLVIMSQAGAGIPLANDPINAGRGMRNGVKDVNGNIVGLADPEKLMQALDTPEDVIRMSIFDMLGNNVDRHNGNWMMAYDKATGKVRIFPVDNTIGIINVEDTDNVTLQYLDGGGFNESDIYQNTMPLFIKDLGKDGVYKIYENEINKIISNLDNPLYKPRGFEMDKIVEKWGSYDAFKEAVSSRLKKLITAGTNESRALKNALGLGYW